LDRGPAIDICIATYKRPESLAALLDSLSRQRVTDFTMRLLIVDNDPQNSAKNTVDQFSAGSSIRIKYACEAIQGIAHARNRALANVQAEYFAFLDDDETVPEDWCSLMLQALERHEADVVFGPVRSLLPSNAPDWARIHPYFKRQSMPTGTPVTTGQTNNVLVRTQSLGSPRQSFDTKYSLTGGEDTDFFLRLHRAGKKMIWCDEAMISEKVPSHRLTIGWICRRGYFYGQSHSRTRVNSRSFLFRTSWYLSRPLFLSAALLKLPFVFLFSRSGTVELLTRISSYGGNLTALFGDHFYYEPYRSSRITSEEGRSR